VSFDVKRILLLLLNIKKLLKSLAKVNIKAKLFLWFLIFIESFFINF